MVARVYVPKDSAAVAVGADDVAMALQTVAVERGVALDIVRTGSYGLYWAEPMIEVETADGRVAYGPVSAGDAPALFDAGFFAGGDHPSGLGPTVAIPWLKRQTRLTFSTIW